MGHIPDQRMPLQWVASAWAVRHKLRYLDEGQRRPRPWWPPNGAWWGAHVHGMWNRPLYWWAALRPLSNVFDRLVSPTHWARRYVRVCEGRMYKPGCQPYHSRCQNIACIWGHPWARIRYLHLVCSSWETCQWVLQGRLKMKSVRLLQSLVLQATPWIHDIEVLWARSLLSHGADSRYPCNHGARISNRHD